MSSKFQSLIRLGVGSSLFQILNVEQTPNSLVNFNQSLNGSLMGIQTVDLSVEREMFNTGLLNQHFFHRKTWCDDFFQAKGKPQSQDAGGPSSGSSEAAPKTQASEKAQAPSKRKTSYKKPGSSPFWSPPRSSPSFF